MNQNKATSDIVTPLQPQAIAASPRADDLPPRYDFMPVDRAVIKTSLRFNPLLFQDPIEFCRNRVLPIRSVWNGNGAKSGRDKLTIKLLNYKGIIVFLDKEPGDELSKVKIVFNPGVCLYGHNGNIIRLEDFECALCLAISALIPLLSDHKDSIDIIPGLRKGGVAYWDYLEIPHQLRDPDMEIFRSFLHVQGKRCTTSVRHWPTSIEIGGHRSKIRYSIYFKAQQLLDTHKNLTEQELDLYRDVLRFELRLRGDKLVEVVGNERNTEYIDGKNRLVCFFPDESFAAHEKCFLELRGVYRESFPLKDLKPKRRGQLQGFGQLLAAAVVELATKSGESAGRVPYSDLYGKWRLYTGASGDTATQVKNFALLELEKNSSLSASKIFNAAAYRLQQQVSCEESEERPRYALDDIMGGINLCNIYFRPNSLRIPSNYVGKYTIC